MPNRYPPIVDTCTRDGEIIAMHDGRDIALDFVFTSEPIVKGNFPPDSDGWEVLRRPWQGEDCG